MASPDQTLPAIEGGTPVRSSFLPFSLPSIGREEVQEVLAALESGWLTTGKRAREFEDRFREYLGCPHAVAVSSCTAALHLSLLAAGVRAGDEVITTPLTFAATGNTICMVGAKPVFADIEADSYNIDPAEIERRITKKTRAIVPVHIGGLPCRMDLIEQIARAHGIPVIEDAAHALGSALPEGKIGKRGKAVCFSFYATKNITTGEGGMVTTDEEAISSRVRTLSLHGLSAGAWDRYSERGGWYYEIEELGFKYNLSDVLAAIGIQQTAKIDRFLHRRAEIAAAYTQAFRELDTVSLPPGPREGTHHSWHLFTLALRVERLRTGRDQFIQALRRENIGTSVHFIPLHLHPFYRRAFNFRKGEFPRAEAIHGRILSLPIYPRMTEEDVRDVISAVTKLLGFYRRGGGS